MKKLICLVLAVMLALSMVAVFAEGQSSDIPFYLHSDVEFGMTLDEVKEKENENGFMVKPAKLTFVDYDELFNITEHNTDGLVVEGSIAGVSDSRIEYHFQNGLLFEAIYIFPKAENKTLTSNMGGMNSSKEEVDVHYDDYKVIANSLSEKYGEFSVDDPDNTVVALINDWVIGVFDEHKSYTTGTTCKIDSFQTFYVPVSDSNNVYIQHLQPTFSWDFSVASVKTKVNRYGHYLVYRLVSDEETDKNDEARQNRLIWEEENRQKEEAEQQMEEDRQKNERNNDL